MEELSSELDVVCSIIKDPSLNPRRITAEELPLVYAAPMQIPQTFFSRNWEGMLK